MDPASVWWSCPYYLLKWGNRYMYILSVLSRLSLSCSTHPVAVSVVTGTPALPVYAGGESPLMWSIVILQHFWYTFSEIQAKSLGMKTEVFDSAGNNIEHTGQPGELVCTRPHVSLPVCFWGDPTGEKFRDAYFSMYPGMFQLILWVTRTYFCTVHHRYLAPGWLHCSKSYHKRLNNSRP
jgi:hypothetical protein